MTFTRKVDNKMSFFLKGIKVPHRKNTANFPTVKMPAPKTVTIPVSMHIGADAKITVKKGDEVFVGTLIAEQNGFVSSPVYSSISGTVSGITEIMLSNGKTCDAVVIESDGQMTLDKNITPPVITDKESLLSALKLSGIVGLGGAGFPTAVKFATDKPIEELIINGAECEPYITSDSITMVERADDIAYAINTLTKYFNIKKVIIGIEQNKPNAIQSMKNLTCENTDITVKVLPSIYPQGGEKVLIYHTTGKVIKLGQLPIDVGCVVSNSTTVAAIGKFLKTGIPLVEKTITVDGGAVNEPKNVNVAIGTLLKDVFEFCGGFKTQPAKVLYGGPMMGISVPNLDMPILKNTNAILAFTENEAKIPDTTSCIKCGACANHCPFGINPVQILHSYKAKDIEGMQKAGTELCMECGCCSFVCPAKIPNVQNNRLAKAALRNAKQKGAK